MLRPGELITSQFGRTAEGVTRAGRGGDTQRDECHQGEGGGVGGVRGDTTPPSSTSAAMLGTGGWGERKRRWGAG